MSIEKSAQGFLLRHHHLHVPVSIRKNRPYVSISDLFSVMICFHVTRPFIPPFLLIYCSEKFQFSLCISKLYLLIHYFAEADEYYKFLNPFKHHSFVAGFELPL